ncbi:zinc finger protein 33B-like [Wyeomyia smithii]|uniref:zinc finger protein 33B-like n=1 Tax=Wyeomyia smithii TaxID=174621 RepID=UPI002467D779|nr:zinc finger protein 33B-like [Wyeomyia smithii]
MAKKLENNEPYRGAVLADELQALLKACVDIGIEEVRRQGGRIESLFYDVQQQMSRYGDFPERKLYRLQTHYLKTERDFLGKKLNPYPPEARQLWGTTEHDAAAPVNDKRWSNLVQKVQKRNQSPSCVTGKEAKEIVRQALQRNLENLSENDQDNVFAQILSELKNKSLFLNRNVAVLKLAYLRLKNQFQKGKARYLLSESAQLWPLNGPEQIIIKTETSRSEDENEPLSHMSESSQREPSPELLETVVETKNECRICQGRLLEECKDLIQDTYNSQTYGKIIQETIQVQIPCDGQASSKICLECSNFVEKMLLFVQQCRKACNILFPLKFDEIFVEEKTNVAVEEDTIAETDTKKGFIENSDPAIDYDSDEVFSPDRTPSPAVVICELKADMDEESEQKIITTEKKNPEIGERCTEETNSNKQEYPEIEVKSAEETISDEQKYLEFVKSLPAKAKKQQCHLCGKTVNRLVNHLASHGPAEFQCDLCPQKCSNKRMLQVHMNRHTKRIAYTCRVCGTVFYHHASWSQHEKAHYAKFNCDKCDAVYKRKAALQQHIKHIHSGIKHLACLSCSFKTFIKSRLLNHVRSLHTSERPYRCTFCETTANSSNSYYTHFQRHKKSGEATEYSMLCAYCGQRFNKDAALEKHICKKHPDVAVVV